MAIELLSGRIEQLVTFINDSSLQPPPMPEDEQAALVKVLGHLKLTHTYAIKDALGKPPSNATASPDVTTSPGTQGQNEPVAAPVRPPVAQAVTWDSLGDVPGPAPAPPSSLSQHATGPSVAAMDEDAAPGVGQPTPEDLMSAAANPPPNWTWSNPEDAGFTFHPAFPVDAGALGDMLCFPTATTMGGDDSAVNLKDVIRLPTCPPDPDEPSDTESTEALVDQLSERIGSLQIGPDGAVRYYGPTSNFNLVEMPAPDNLTVHRTIRNDGQEYLDRLGMGKQVPPALEEHLVNLYFTWQDPAFHVVDRPMFEAAKVSWRENDEDTPFYSEALQNAM